MADSLAGLWAVPAGSKRPPSSLDDLWVRQPTPPVTPPLPIGEAEMQRITGQPIRLRPPAEPPRVSMRIPGQGPTEPFVGEAGPISREAVGSLWQQTRESVPQVGVGAVETAGAVGPALLTVIEQAHPPDPSPILPEKFYGAGGIGSRKPSAAERFFEPPKTPAGQFGRAVGSTVPFAVAGALSPPLAVGMTAASGLDEAQRRAAESGIELTSPERAAVTAGGLAIGLTELLPLMKSIKLLKGMGRIAKEVPEQELATALYPTFKQYAMAGGEQMVEEALQEGGSAAAQTALQTTYGGARTEDIFDPRKLAPEAGMGGGVGLLMSLLSTFLGSRIGRSRLRAAGIDPTSVMQPQTEAPPQAQETTAPTAPAPSAATVQPEPAPFATQSQPQAAAAPMPEAAAPPLTPTERPEGEVLKQGILGLAATKPLRRLDVQQMFGVSRDEASAALSGLVDAGALKTQQGARGRTVWAVSSPSSQSTPMVPEGDDIERYQWKRNAQGGQQYGNKEVIRPLTGLDFHLYVLPKLRDGYAGTFAEYKQKHPDATHISLVKVGGKDWALNGVGLAENLRPKPGDPSWVKQVESFDDEEALKQGSTADEPVDRSAVPIPTVPAEPTLEPPEAPPAAPSTLVSPEAPASTPEPEGVDWRPLISQIRRRLNAGYAIGNNEEFMALVRHVTGRSVGAGEFQTKQAYDALETAINQEIAEGGQAMLQSPVEVTLGTLRSLLSRLPTQNIRSDEQKKFQQFSTPPTLAYVAARVAGITPADTVLEPSAGTGSLAAWARAAGATVVANEVDQGRADLLEQSGYTVTRENAEQLHNILPSSVQPTVVLMNPPFSASGVRGVRNASEIGYQHVEQALARLQPGGRLVAILGGGVSGKQEGARLTAPQARKFWIRVAKTANIRANIGIGGSEYAKYGTSYPTRLVVIDKTGPTPNYAAAIQGDFNSLEEAWRAIEPIANDRGQPPAAVGQPGFQPSASVGEGGNAIRGVRGPGVVSGTGDTGRPQAVPRPTGSGASIGPLRSPEGAPGAAGIPSRLQDPEHTGRPLVPVRGDLPAGSPGSLRSTSVEPVSDQSVLEKAAQLLQQEANEAERYLREIGFYNNLGSGNVDPRAIVPLSKIGANFMAQGLVSMKKWTAAMVEKFGERIRPMLAQIREAAEELFEQMLSRARASLSTTSIQQPPAPTQATRVTAEDQQSVADAGPRQDEGDFTVYKPSKLPANWGAQPHNAKIVETQAMAAVEEPTIRVKPNIPDTLITSGVISEVQLVAVAGAVQAHQNVMADGKRQGYFIGDGTGVGKGREIAAIALHNWNSGVRKQVWVSYRDDLVKDAIRDLTDIGANIPIKTIRQLPKGDISKKFTEGIVFIPYTTLASSETPTEIDTRGKKVATGPTTFARVEQIVNWAGPEPLIIFDEAHEAKNAVPGKSKRGKAKPSHAGTAVATIQDRLPGARVLYSSATGFSDPSNLGYANRLGLWGEGTAFNDFGAFRFMMERGGIGAMEMVARDMKAMGRYVARFISYGADKNGIPVEFSEITHELTPEQEAIYNTAAEAWRVVRERMGEAFAETEAGKDTKAKVASRFWNAAQRFNRTVLTAMKLPTLFREIDAALGTDKSIVISVMSTGEATLQRRLAQAHVEEDSLDNLDLSPALMLQELVDKSFPTVQYEEVVNPNDPDSTIQAPVRDSQGNLVHNAAALAMKADLLAQLNKLHMPESALDQIINKYGAVNVAEMTGRKQRLLVDPKTGKRAIDTRKAEGDDALLVEEARLFNEGRKRIAIISSAASTGISLHSDLRFKNQQRRVHIILELKWSADEQMQDFGRTHRTNQSIPPEYNLLSVNVGGDKRFSSSIARRLEQLGALSRGARGSAGGGEIAKYNFESTYGQAAVTEMVESLKDGESFNGVPGEDILGLMGLAKEEKAGDDERPKHWRREEDREVEVTQFLNRVLMLPVRLQNAVFDRFMENFGKAIEFAKREGTFDHGAEKINAERVTLVKQEEIRRDENTGARTIHYELEAEHKRARLTWTMVQDKVRSGGRLLRQNTSGRLVVREREGEVRTTESGSLETRYWVTGASGTAEHVADHTIKEKFTPAPADATAEMEWNKQHEEAGEFRKEKIHLIGGSVLPIYDKLADETKSGTPKPPKVQIADMPDGNRIIGVHVGTHRIRQVLRSLGVGSKINTQQVFESVMEHGQEFTLSHGMRLKRVRIAGEDRFELQGVHGGVGASTLVRMGLFRENIRYQDRWFIPTDPQTGPAVLGRLLKEFPSISDDSGAITMEEAITGEAKARGSVYLGSGLGELQSVYDRLTQRASPPPDVVVPPFADPEVEARFQAASQPEDRPAAWQKVKDVATFIAQNFNREFQHLPRGAEFAAFIFEANRYKKAHAMAFHRAVEVLIDTWKSLTPNEYELARRLVVLDDAVARVESELEADPKKKFDLPFGVKSVDELRAMQTTYGSIANEKVQSVLAARKQIQESLKQEYIDAMKLAGVNKDLAKTLSRKDYFHHEVLAYRNLEQMNKIGGKAVQTPVREGWLKHSEVNPWDYSTDLLRVELEIMARMMHAAAKARFIGWIRHSQYNQTGRFKAQAAVQNKATVMSYFEALASEANKGRDPSSEAPLLTGEDMFRRLLNWRQAKAIKDLVKLAEDGALPNEGGKWNTFLDALADGTEDKGDFHRYVAFLLKGGDAMRAQHPKAVQAAALYFAGVTNKRRTIKELAGDKHVTWQQMMPRETHAAWQPIKGQAFYLGTTIPEELALKIAEAGGAQLGVRAEDLRKAMVMGGHLPEMALPLPIVQTMNAFTSTTDPTSSGQVILSGFRAVTAAWKRFKLFAPTHVAPYMLRNIGSDTIKVSLGQPAIFRKAAPALRDIRTYYKTGAMSPALKDWFNMGGLWSVYAVQELGDEHRVKGLEHLLERKLQKDTPAGVQHIKDAWNWYWDKTANVNAAREAVLRYAAFLHFREEIARNGGKPKRYGGSLREEVDALEGKDRKAYKLSNDLLGAYDEVSKAGVGLSNTLYPFFRYQESNMRTFWRLARNAYEDGRLAASVGATVAPAGLMASAMLGRVLLLSLFSKIAFTVFNNLMWPDEEKALDEEERGRTHIFLFRGPDGKVRKYDRFDPFDDVLEWVGLHTVLDQTRRLVNGTATPADIAKELARRPAWASANKAVQGLTPWFKIPAEAISGRQFFPDFMKPHEVASGEQYLVDQLELRRIYNAATGRPRPPFSPLDLVTAGFDAEQSAYFRARDIVAKYNREKRGIGRGSREIAGKSEALYNLKMAVRLNDKEATGKYLREYMAYGKVTPRTLRDSFSALHPLHAMPKEFRSKFMASLKPEEVELIRRGEAYYRDQLLGGRPPAAIANELYRLRAVGE